MEKLKVESVVELLKTVLNLSEEIEIKDNRNVMSMIEEGEDKLSEVIRLYQEIYYEL